MIYEFGLHTIAGSSGKDDNENQRKTPANPQHVYTLSGHHGELPSFYTLSVSLVLLHTQLLVGIHDVGCFPFFLEDTRKSGFVSPLQQCAPWLISNEKQSVLDKTVRNCI